MYFPEEEATQNDIVEKELRPVAKKSLKKKPVKTKKPKKQTLLQLPMTKKRKGPLSKLSAQEIKDRSKKAKSLGLPEGWLAMNGNNYAITIWNPDGDIFHSRKRAFESLGLSDDEAKEDNNTQRHPRRAKKAKKNGRRASRRTIASNVKPRYALDESEPEEDPNDLIPYSPPGQKKEEFEEGDPPWRREGHPLLGRLVDHSFRSDSGRRVTQRGIITGWLDNSDVDSSGQPAYVNEKSKKPEKLFHIDFDETSEIAFIDKEEYELKLVDEKENDKKKK